MNAKLVKDNGIVKISVNGQILDAVGYMTYNPDGGQFPKFDAIGNRIVFFGAYATDQGLNTLAGSRQFSPHFYLGEDTFDFTKIDRILERIAPCGVHIYSQTGDQLFAGGKFVGIYAESAGEKRISFRAL